MSTAPRHLPRRQFMKRATAVGLAGAAPVLLPACSSGDDAADLPPPAGGREARHLNFDLSLAEVQEPRLFALKSPHHGQPLQVHTSDSRARHKASNPVLSDVPDEKLTHYLEATDLPAGALQSVLIMGTDPVTGQPVLAGAHIHAPIEALAAVAKRHAAQPARGAARFSAKRQAYGIAPKAEGDPLPDDINAFSTPWDIATFLVFHHPEVMNLKPDLGADILDRIGNLPCAADDPNCTPYLGTLAFKIATRISERGYPTTTPGSWATLVPQTYSDGRPVLDDAGQTVFGYDVADDIAQAADAVAQEIKKNIYDDPLFAGTNWQPTQGMAAKPAVSKVAAAVHGTLKADEAFAVQAAHPAGATLHGLHFVGFEVTNSGNRSVRVELKNQHLRFQSVYVQYQDATGKALPVTNPGELDSDRASFVGMIPTNDQIMGIPFQGNTIDTSDVNFSMPPEAARARVMFGSLGLGGEAFTKEALPGSILTLAFNIGIPTMLLAAGVYSDLKGGWEGMFEDVPLLTAIVKEVRGSLFESFPDLAEGIYSSGTTLSIQPFITGVANFVVQALLASSPALLKYLAEEIASSVLLALAVPFIAFGLKVLAVAADLLAIGFTVGEVLSSPAIADNVVSLQMRTTVRISKDPRDFQFPASARKYRVDAFYDGAVPRYVEGTITQGRVDPIDAILEDVPSGGKVVFKVTLYSDDGCLVGLVNSDPIVNLPDTAGLVPLEIVELVAPLNQNTQYVHSLKLQYENNARTWVSTAPPELTRANLGQGADNTLTNLGGITVHTASGMAGYGFLAGGQNVGQCGGSGGGNATLNTIQNVFLGNNPERALKFSGCGYTQPVGIVYDPVGPAVGGHHFFVQPANDGFHVRSLSLDNTTPFNMNQKTSWGRFSNALDSLTVLPSGFLVGVNRQTHKMEVLTLPSTAVDQALEPKAVPFAAMKAGKGTREGLLDTPVAVATAKGAVLVLEQGNKRVQAFDVSGNPVSLFKDSSTALMPLQEESGVTYLDLAVEGLGYMYVLSYSGNGLVPGDYRLDLYTPNGDHQSRTVGVAAARLAVDLFRNVYTLNYEPVKNSPRVEPSISQWLPRTPNACPTTIATVASARQAMRSGCRGPATSAV